MAIKNILGNPNVRNYIAATKQPVNVMNTNKRGSASIVIDTSGSMNPYRDLLKRLICEFYDDVLKDPIASNILELSIITFNSDVFILQPMSEVKAQEKKGKDIDLHCEGLTLTCSKWSSASTSSAMLLRLLNTPRPSCSFSRTASPSTPPNFVIRKKPLWLGARNTSKSRLPPTSS